MSIIDDALRANATIAIDFDPDRGKPPAPKIAIVTCADPRLSNILPMLGLAEADVDMIRNFGTVIDDGAVLCSVGVPDLIKAHPNPDDSAIS
jgi:carbonic anhydrase